MNIESIIQVDSLSLQSTATAAAARALEEFSGTADAISRGQLDPALLVSLKEQSIRYTINLELIKVADEMIGQVLDTLA